METERVLVTLHLPLEMGLAGRILELIGKDHPTAIVRPGDDEKSLEIILREITSTDD